LSSIVRRFPAALPWGLCVAVVVVLLPRDAWSDVRVLIALGLQLAVGGCVALAARGIALRVVALSAITAWFVALALLRHNVGATSGFGALVFLPVMWSALQARRLELAWSLVCLALVYVVPQVVVGGPHYPSSGWQSVALSLVTATSLGMSVMALVTRMRMSNRRSKAALASMSEGLILIREGVIITVNPAFCRMTGMPASELLGASAPFAFWPPELSEQITALRERVAAGDHGEFELTLLAADGRRVPVSVTSALTDLGDGGVAMLNTVRDITDRRVHEEAQRRHLEELNAIATVTRSVGHSDPGDARNAICRTALQVSSARGVRIWEPVADGGLVTSASRPVTEHSLRIEAAEAEHGVHLVVRTGKPLFIADARSSVHCDQRLTELVETASTLFQPILGAEGVRGVLSVSWSEPVVALTEQEQLIFGVLADEAAIAMQRADLLARLDELTRTDALTGLPNRRAWDELLARELATARRAGKPLAVAMLDLDHFKSYNDERGHPAGDHLLRGAAATWRESLRQTDVLARWGGEEFALLLPGCDGAAAVRLIDRLRGTLADGVTFSAGVSISDGDTAPDDLVDAADHALYRAKTAGRDRVLLAQPAV
jgi:diguanylate cyclase (GGDEF)-like protein/PAS domain S-box-containing protein